MPAAKYEIPKQALGFGFGRPEAVQVGIGVGVMTLAFALGHVGGVRHLLEYFSLGGARVVRLIFAGARKACRGHYPVVTELRSIELEPAEGYWFFMVPAREK